MLSQLFRYSISVLYLLCSLSWGLSGQPLNYPQSTQRSLPASEQPQRASSQLGLDIPLVRAFHEEFKNR